MPVGEYHGQPSSETDHWADDMFWNDQTKTWGGFDPTKQWPSFTWGTYDGQPSTEVENMYTNGVTLYWNAETKIWSI